jgi:hypothetical protein
MTRANIPISFLRPDGTWRNDQDRLLCPYCGRIVHEQYTICTACKSPFTGATWKYLREKFPKFHSIPNAGRAGEADVPRGHALEPGRPANAQATTPGPVGDGLPQDGLHQSKDGSR